MADRLVTPGSEISPDTHVGSRPDRIERDGSGERPAANPEALVEGNRVSTGRELET